ncbi:DNA mismatch repair protein MutT [Chitinophagaceae bacterium IBVUCB2]|nr:DNA mismatch repair protein MutT [Chitinophagaceae bacterium IBVUCB2]
MVTRHKKQFLMNSQWQTLSSEYLFNDPWFKVRKEKYKTPTGKIVEPYYVYEFPTWVGVVPITEEGKVVMIKQYRHAIGEVCIEIPGGCVDDTDKDYETAAARELLEETGYIFSSYDYLGKISPNPSTNTNFLHMFLAKGGKKVAQQKLDANEEIEIVLLSVGELKTLVREHKIVQSMHISCILYALEKLNELSY